MKLISKIILGTTGATVFVGTAYVCAITLAPPPTYDVSNTERLRSYDKLAVNNVYEKKTKSQEFYLGLSRWRRKMLKDEGVLQGRVLEIGAGCGSNLAYYPQHAFTEDSDVREFLLARREGAGSTAAPSAGGTENRDSYILEKVRKTYPCTEVVLCDRAPGMVESCVQKIQTRLGYTPFRYPDYDLDGTRKILGSRAPDTEEPGSGNLRRRKAVHSDGSVKEILVTSLTENEEQLFLEAEAKGEHVNVAPILKGFQPGDALPLLSKQGREEVKRRQQDVDQLSALRQRIIGALETETQSVINRREARGVAGDGPDNTAGNPKPPTKGGMSAAGSPESIDAVLTDSTLDVSSKRSLFSVANYAAEQLPFPDNSFDTIVETFGLCSYDDPVRALREMSRVCKPSGRLLLIEHGRGSTSRVNNHLDKWAPRHAKSWGCWWNRDIRRIIRLSGLSVEKWESKHFGTSHYIIAKPFKTMDEWDKYARSNKKHA